MSIGNNELRSVSRSPLHRRPSASRGAHAPRTNPRWTPPADGRTDQPTDRCAASCGSSAPTAAGWPLVGLLVGAVVAGLGRLAVPAARDPGRRHPAGPHRPAEPARPRHDRQSPSLTSVFGVLQTLISTTVGQRVMHDLRTAVYAHLQRMSLAFFTRTRTGEVQSRIANDIGGMQATVTSTATSLVSNLTSVVATDRRDARAGLAADRRLAAAAAGVRVDQPPGRQRAQADHHPAAAADGRDVRDRSPSRCRSAASCSAAPWAAPTRSPRPSPTESERAGRPRGALQHGRALADVHHRHRHGRDARAASTGRRA